MCDVNLVYLTCDQHFTHCMETPLADTILSNLMTSPEIRDSEISQVFCPDNFRGAPLW